MPIAAVAIDRYKLPTFKKYLDNAGYKFTENDGVTADTMILRVDYEFIDPLTRIIKAAEFECKQFKKGKLH